MVSGRALKFGVLLRIILDLAWYLLIAVGVLGVLLIVMIMTRGDHVRADLPVTFQAQSAGKPLASLTSLTNLSGTVRTPASVLSALLILCFVVVAWGLALLALRQLRLVLGDALAGSPFTAPNARRVGMLGLIVVLAELLRAFAYFVASLWARGHVHLPGLTVQVIFPVQISTLVAGLLVLFLAEVFRIGHALQQDRDLTI